MIPRRVLHLLVDLLLLPTPLCLAAVHAPSPTTSASLADAASSITSTSPRRRQLDLSNGAGLPPGFLPKEFGDMHVDVPLHGDMQSEGVPADIPDFVQDALSSLQNGQLPTMAVGGLGSPMDTQPFVNGSMSTSTATSTVSTLPDGGKVTIEHTMSMQMYGYASGAESVELPPQMTTKSACTRQTVTSTVTVTRTPCSSAAAITRTRTKVEVVTSTSTRTVTMSASESTTTTQSVSAPPPPPPPPKPTSSAVQVTTSSRSTSLSQVTTKSPTPPPPPKPSEEPASGGGSAPAGFGTEVLAAHNDWRAKYQAGPLSWDDKLASKADSWAKACNFVHEEGFASNLDSAGSSNGKPELSAQAVLEHWVTGPNERDAFAADKNALNHFTQVVWKSAKTVGCAIYMDCKLSNYESKWWPNAYAVCYYDTGNVIGAGSTNVGSLRA